MPPSPKSRSRRPFAEEAAESAEDFTDSEYALGEFIDRYGPRLAHFNGVMQLLSQLAMPEDENQN